MQPEFWSERWRTGQIGFHQARADKHLTRHWRELNLAQGSRVFVPLCGKSLDLLWLRDHGHPVVGVELSAIALEAFCMENGVPARRRTRRDFRATPDFDVATSDFDLATSDFEVYEAPNLELFCGDYFALTQAQLGDLAAVFDRAALISWTEDLRAAYALHMTQLTRPGSEMLLITLEYPQAQMAGPPFSVPQKEVEELYGSRYMIRELSRQDVLASEPRFRSRGVTELHEVCYRLTRS